MERKRVKVESEDMQVTITKDEFLTISATEIAWFLKAMAERGGAGFVEATGDLLTAVIGEISIKMFKEDN